MDRVRILAVGILLGGLLPWGLGAAQPREGEPAARGGDEKLRLKVEKNVMDLVKKLDVPEKVEQSARACFAREKWDAALESFRTVRGKEIQGHAHGLVKTTMPKIMQEFMPKYVQAKIMADRRAKKAGGPPSPAEIDKIRANAMAKMQPAMQQTIMPAMQDLSGERMEELLKDEKVLTRVLADQVLKGNFLPDAAEARFKADLEKAGYPASLTSGADPVLNERCGKMMRSIDIAAVAKKAGL